MPPFLLDSPLRDNGKRGYSAIIGDAVAPGLSFHLRFAAAGLPDSGFFYGWKGLGVIPWMRDAGIYRYLIHVVMSVVGKSDNAISG